MNQIHQLLQYLKGKWEVHPTPETLLVGTLLDTCGYFHLIVEDLNGKHSLKREQLDNCVRTDTLATAVSKLVFNTPIASISLSASSMVDIYDPRLVNGVVFIKELTPIVFNSSTTFQTQAFNGGSLIIDYLDLVESDNDLTLGAIDNIANFIPKQLGDINEREMEASLLLINNVLVKTSDYFKSLGSDVVVRSYKAEALMALLIEARLSPRDVGITGQFKRGDLMSRLVCSRIIKHPDVIALVNPALEPVQLQRRAVTKSVGSVQNGIVFRGNRPTTYKTVLLPKNKEPMVEIVALSGVQQESSARFSQDYQVQVVYPEIEWLEPI